jgi:DHA1 family tetracycline resistance protein-like MFS transporter
VLKVSDRVLIRVAPFGIDLVSSIYYLAAPLVLIELNANPIELGLVGTLTSSVHMGMAHFMGRLSDRLGRRPLIIIAPLLLSVSCLLMLILRSVGLILTLSILNGLCTSIFWPCFLAWIADRLTKGSLVRDLGSFNSSWTSATLFGPVFSGFMYALHPRLPFVLGAALALTVFLIVWRSLQDEKIQLKDEERFVALEKSNIRMNLLYAAWVANFASFFVIANARYQFPKLARELDFSSGTIGLIIGCLGFALFSGFFILRKSDRWHSKASYLVESHALAVVGLLLIYLSSRPFLFAFALILIGLSASVTCYSSQFYVVQLMKKKGKGSGIHESIVGAGALSGPILGGVAAQFAGLRAPYLLCLVVLLVAVIVEIVLLKRVNTHAVGSQN